MSTPFSRVAFYLAVTFCFAVVTGLAHASETNRTHHFADAPDLTPLTTVRLNEPVTPWKPWDTLTAFHFLNSEQPGRQAGLGPVAAPAVRGSSVAAAPLKLQGQFGPPPRGA